MQDPPTVPPGHTFVGFTADGAVVTSKLGIVIDDAYLEADRLQYEKDLARRDALIAEHGSLEAVYAHQDAEAAQYRRAYFAARAHWRISSARSRRSRSSVASIKTKPSTRVPRPRERRSSSSSRTSSTDPGDPEPSSSCELCRLDGVEINHSTAAGDCWTCLACHLEVAS